MADENKKENNKKENPTEEGKGKADVNEKERSEKEEPEVVKCVECMKERKNDIIECDCCEEWTCLECAKMTNNGNKWFKMVL